MQLEVQTAASLCCSCQRAWCSRRPLRSVSLQLWGSLSCLSLDTSLLQDRTYVFSDWQGSVELFDDSYDFEKCQSPKLSWELSNYACVESYQGSVRLMSWLHKIEQAQSALLWSMLPANLQMFERETAREKNLEKAAKEAKNKARKEAGKAGEPEKALTDADLQQVQRTPIHVIHDSCVHPASEDKIDLRAALTPSIFTWRQYVKDRKKIVKSWMNSVSGSMKYLRSTSLQIEKEFLEATGLQPEPLSAPS